VGLRQADAARPLRWPESDAERVQLAQEEFALLERKVQSLEERLRLERIARYGSRSEKLSDLQLSLLDFEPAVSSEEIAAESKRPPLTASEENFVSLSAKAKQRKHPGRNKLPAHLPRVEKIIACTAQECLCGKCGATTKVIGYEECEVLDVKPAEYFVTVIKREKRARAQCMNNGVQTAATARIGTTSAAKAWCMPVAWRTREESLSMPSRSMNTTSNQRVWLSGWMRCLRLTARCAMPT